MPLYLMERLKENEDAVASNDFASKWGWFGVMHRLCGEDISKLEKYYKLESFRVFNLA